MMQYLAISLQYVLFSITGNNGNTGNNGQSITKKLYHGPVTLFSAKIYLKVKCYISTRLGTTLYHID